MCNIWTDVKLLWLLPFYICREPFTFAGGGSRVQSLPPTKTLWFPWWYMAWSAMRTCQFSGMGRGSTQEPPRHLFDNFNLLHCWRNLESILTFTCIRTFLRFSPKPYRRQYYDFLTYFAEIMSPTNFGYCWETIAETLFWIFNMLVKTLWTLVLTTFDNIGCPTSFSRSTSYGSFTNLTI